MESLDKSSDHKSMGDIPTIKMYQDIVDRAHTEVESVRKMYYWLSGVIGLILSVGIASATYLTYKSFHEMRADMKEEIEIMKKRATQDYSMLATDLKSTVESKSHNVEQLVNSRIDAEFNKDNIQVLVKDKAQERIDKVADNYIEKHIASKITPQINAVDKNLKAVEINVEFNAAVTAALNDDRLAFDLLRKWAHDNKYPLMNKAKESVDGIIHIKSSTFQYITWENTYPWENIDPSRLDIGDLKKRFKSDALSGLRAALLEYLDTRKDITDTDKLKFLQEVLLTDKSLDVSIRAIQLSNKITKESFDPFDTKTVLDWYRKKLF